MSKEAKDQNFEGMLKAKSLRATPIRKRILKALANATQPLTVDDLFMKMQGKFDRVTLYRNVNSFTESGLVVAIDLGMGKTFYEFTGVTKGHHHHHHIVCQKCEKIEHLEVCGLELHFKMLESMGYKNLRHNLEFSGLCKTCH